MRNSQSSKANTSFTVTLPSIKQGEHEDTSVTISFTDLEKTLTIFTGDDTYPIY